MSTAMQGLILTLTTGLIWGGVGIVFSRVVKRKMDFYSFMLLSSGLILIFSMAIIPDYRAIMSGDAGSGFPGLLVVMLAVAATSNIGFLKMRGAMQCGHHGFAWAIAQSAMVLPFIFALLFWHEKAEISRIAGVIMILASFVFLSLKELRNTGKKADMKSDGINGKGSKWILFSISAFLLIGLSQIFSILPSHWDNWSDKGALRVPLLCGGTFIFWAAYIFLKGGRIEFKGTYLYSFIYAFLVLGGQIFLYKSLDVMAAAKISSLVYPLAIGICITMVVAYSALKLKEEFGISGIAGILMSLLGIILVSV
ncbi:MAG TPA: hypothetical protein DET40_07050 [Lentisphaeria bacterium]|nr:MAG: hypothetical protein A2X45_07250 [Lentisphaerae bacterium GWF2_50_93]HCE43288.1 hypothetical protein [Lentisphaeria bacterium]